MNALTSPAPASAQAPVAVEISSLTKRYGTLTAVDRLSLAVPRGALFGLLGPNGAGKSTTFGVMCGWLHADEGETSILGTSSRKLFQLRGRVAALPQDAAFPRQVSVLRQLVHYAVLGGMDHKRAPAEARRLLAAVGLPEVERRRGGELSHGMLKRVGLAQALLGSPEVILLDEPTSGLDPASARLVKDLIRSLAPRATVIVSSHNLAEVQEICTHGAILDRGRLVVAGTIAELTRQRSEVTIELAPGAQVPLSELRAALGEEAVQLGASGLRVTAKDEDVAALISKTLRILLAHDTPILGVARGTSLEAAFLDVTRRAN